MKNCSGSIRCCCSPRLRLSRGDGEPLLLAGISHVLHGGALHVALPSQIVEIGAAMHGAPIVPDHEIMYAPAMRVDELPLGGVREKLLDEGARLGLR